LNEQIDNINVQLEAAILNLDQQLAVELAGKWALLRIQKRKREQL
jgi:hypothetical protein